MNQPHESIPTPDPTILTTQALLREISTLKELFEVSSKVTDTRLQAMDKAIVLLQQFTDKQPTTAAVAQSVESLRALTHEKFNSIALQFEERDKRMDNYYRDSKNAVDAALQAQKDASAAQNQSNSLAIGKSELLVIKQIDGIMMMIGSNTKAVDDKIEDIKTQLTGMTGHSKGVADGWGYLVGVVGFLTGLILFVMHLQGK